MEKKMSNDVYTEDLADFGYREQDIAKDIFEAWKKNGLPEDFENEGVKLGFNRNSGYVFLTNSEYQVAMVEEDKENNLSLYSFYTSPYEGVEGSFEDILDQFEDLHPEDQEWFENIASNINRSGDVSEAKIAIKIKKENQEAIANLKTKQTNQKQI